MQQRPMPSIITRWVVGPVQGVWVQNVSEHTEPTSSAKTYIRCKVERHGPFTIKRFTASRSRPIKLVTAAALDAVYNSETPIGMLLRR